METEGIVKVEIKKLQRARKRRAIRVRQGLKTSLESKLRVSVFRSSKHIYVQLINDQEQKTVLTESSLKVDKKDLDKKGVARLVGLEFAKKALAANANNVCFDRGQYLYHGRVKSLAEGLREGGLKI